MENNKLKKLAKKLNLKQNLVEQMIIQNHQLENFYKEKELKNIQIDDVNLKTFKELQKISSTLKVSVDAVVTVLLLNYLETETNKLSK